MMEDEQRKVSQALLLSDLLESSAAKLMDAKTMAPVFLSETAAYMGRLEILDALHHLSLSGISGGYFHRALLFALAFQRKAQQFQKEMRIGFGTDEQRAVL